MIYLDWDLYEQLESPNNIVKFNSLHFDFTNTKDEDIIITGNPYLIDILINNNKNIIIYSLRNYEKYKTISNINDLKMYLKDNKSLVITKELEDNVIDNELNRIKINTKHISKYLDSSELNEEYFKNVANYQINLDRYNHYYNEVYNLSNIDNSNDDDDIVVDTVGDVVVTDDGLDIDFSRFYAVVFNILLRKGKLKSKRQIFSYHVLKTIKYNGGKELRLSNEYDTKEYHNILEGIFNQASDLASLANIEFIKPNIIYEDKGLNFNDSKIDYQLWFVEDIKYQMNIFNDRHIRILRQFLKLLFGFDDFRDGQLEIITNILNRNNTLGILTTGAGKSLTFYFSVLLQPQQSWIIAPINALIFDQMKILNDRYGITTVSSLISTDGNDYDQAKLKFENNQSQFIFSSPERFQNTEFREILKNKTIKKEIGTIVFDEVHCLSEWGHDFRIAYLMMTETINDYSYNVNYLGLTATASIRVLKDLMNELSIETHNVISGKNLKRDNLVFAIKTFDSKTEAVKDMNVVVNDFIKTTNNSSAIIFSQNVNPGLRSNPNIFSILSLQENFRINSANNFSKIGIYHGSERSSHIPFLEDELKVLISTKAFGMGIDKPNIGLTMHMGMPSSRESFYQEAGRAGRDGKDSVCYLYSINPTPLDKRNLAVFFNDFTRSTVSLSNLDINQNIYFYSVDFDLPEKEKEKANEYYEQILNGKRSFGFFKTYQINEYDKYFYILHRIGVIKNWTIRYTGGYSRGFYDLEVSDDLSDLAVFKENILKYIVTRISDNEDVKSIENEVYSTPNVKELVFVFRRWYHENFIQTRKRELSNMLSMIETFGNDINNSDEVQLMMESYFNIDSIIGQSDKGYSLEFKTETLEEVINYVFKVNDDELNKRYYESERMSESYPNNKKLNLFMSLLSLRLGTFISSSNGASLFERTINSFNDTEKVDVLNILLSLYQNLKEEEKESLILSLIMVYDLETFIHKIYDKNYDNELITNVKLDYLNKILMEVLQ